MRNRRGMHERLAGEEGPERGSDRLFGAVFAVVFSIIGLLPLAFGGTPRWWAFGVAGGLLFIAAVRPPLLSPLNRVWFQVRLILNRILTYVLMGLLFYAVFTPIGLAARALGKDSLRRRYDRDAATYWIRREPGPPPESMKNQF